MNSNSELLKLVIAILRGINANAEIMKHIISELSIQDEVRHQLNGGESVLMRIENLAADELVDNLVDEISEIGDDLISDFSVSVYNKAIDVSDFEIDDSEVRSAVKKAINKHFEII
jgi:hypothetical protein